MSNNKCARCDALEAEVARLKNELATWDPVFAIRQALPSEAEAGKLLRIVCGRYPHLKENSPERECIDNFLASLAYVFSLKQTPTPTVAYQGSWWLTQANMWVSNSRINGRVRTLVPAIVATGSVPYMLDHGSIFLDPHRARGTPVDRSSWKRILNGGDLLAAVPIKQVRDESIGPVKVLAGTW